MTIKAVLSNETIKAISRAFGEGRTQQWMRDFARAIEAAVLAANRRVQAKALTDDLYILSMNEESMEEAIQRFKGSSTGEALKVVFAAQKSLRALLASPPSAQADVAAAPKGWKLVPIEPTDEMTFIGQSMRYDSANSIGSIYAAMTDAAPTAQAYQYVCEHRFITKLIEGTNVAISPAVAVCMHCGYERQPQAYGVDK